MMGSAPVLAAAAGRVPDYDGAAEITGSVIFLALLVVFAAAAVVKRRR
jgi:uncharacterized protein (TIGR03382 family)